MDKFYSHIITVEFSIEETSIDFELIEKKFYPLEIYEVKHATFDGKCIIISFLGSRSASIRVFNHFSPQKAIYLLRGSCCMVKPLKIFKVTDYNSSDSIIDKVAGRTINRTSISQIVDLIGDNITDLTNSFFQNCRDGTDEISLPAAKKCLEECLRKKVLFSAFDSLKSVSFLNFLRVYDELSRSSQNGDTKLSENYQKVIAEVIADPDAKIIRVNCTTSDKSNFAFENNNRTTSPKSVETQKSKDIDKIRRARVRKYEGPTTSTFCVKSSQKRKLIIPSGQNLSKKVKICIIF